MRNEEWNTKIQEDRMDEQDKNERTNGKGMSAEQRATSYEHGGVFHNRLSLAQF